MFFLDAVSDYLRHIATERRFSPGTCGTYKWWLHNYSRFVIESGYPAPVTVQDAYSLAVLRRYQQSFADRKLKNRTVLAAFYGVRGLGDYLVSQKILDENPVRELTMPPKGATVRTVVSTDELKKMLSACLLQRDKTRIAYERAILSTLIYTGVRAMELIDMRLSDVRLDAQTLIIPHGKGDKSRVLYPPSDFWSAMREWLALRPSCNHDWLWPCDVRRRISVETMRKDLEEIKARAGLSQATYIKPHSIRHAFATRMMGQGANIRSIQASLGHSDAQTTLNYLHFGEEAAKDMRRFATIDADTVVAIPSSTSTPKPTRSDLLRQRSRRMPVAHR